MDRFHILCIFAGITCAVILCIAGHEGRFPRNPHVRVECPEVWQQPVEPGPVAPEPKIDQFVRSKIIQECVENGECLTRDRLEQEYGIRLICVEEVQRYGTRRQVNHYEGGAVVPCSKVDTVVLRDGIKVKTQ